MGARRQRLYTDGGKSSPFLTPLATQGTHNATPIPIHGRRFIQRRTSRSGLNRRTTLLIGSIGQHLSIGPAAARGRSGNLPPGAIHQPSAARVFGFAENDIYIRLSTNEFPSQRQRATVGVESRARAVVPDAGTRREREGRGSSAKKVFAVGTPTISSLHGAGKHRGRANSRSKRRAFGVGRGSEVFAVADWNGDSQHRQRCDVAARRLQTTKYRRPALLRQPGTGNDVYVVGG